MQLSEKLPKYRWIILAVLWMSWLTVFLARLSIGPLAPFLKESLNLSNTQIGALVTATGITYIPTLIFAGWLVDRIGVRWVLITGTLITGLCTTAIFFAPSYQAIFIILALSGFGAGCIFPSAVQAIILWFPLRERATAFGLNMTAINVAGIIGALLLPTTAIALGWEYGFLFLGFGALAICLCCTIFYRNPPQNGMLVAVQDTPDSPLPKPSTTQLTIDLFKSRDIWMLSLAGFFLCIAEFATIAYLVLYLTEDLLFGVVAAGGLLAMTEAAGAMGKPTSGFISDRLLGGHRKIAFLLMGGTSGMTLLILGIWGYSLSWMLYPILIILGVMAIGWGGLYTTLVGELAGTESAGMAAGVGNVMLVLGVMTGPPLFGYIVDSTGSFQIAWLIMALSAAVSMLFISLVREHKRRI